jgi:hypothetical protein
MATYLLRDRSNNHLNFRTSDPEILRTLLGIKDSGPIVILPSEEFIVNDFKISVETISLEVYSGLPKIDYNGIGNNYVSSVEIKIGINIKSGSANKYWDKNNWDFKDDPYFD